VVVARWQRGGGSSDGGGSGSGGSGGSGSGAALAMQTPAATAMTVGQTSINNQLIVVVATVTEMMTMKAAMLMTNTRRRL
jgi:hypothetical protein